MAVMDFRGSGMDESGWSLTGRLARFVNVAGAVVSVLLIAGLVIWGYRLVMRDVTGIPVVKAMEGPARIAPEEPGGDLARHTGLAVNEVAADAPAHTVQTSPLVLAPPQIGLEPGDVPMGDLGATAREASAGTDPTLLLPEENITPLTDAEMAARLRVAPSLGADTPAEEAPVTDAIVATAPPTEAEAAEEAAAAAAPVERRSAVETAVAEAMSTRRPSARPAGLSRRVAAASPAPAAATPAPRAERSAETATPAATPSARPTARSTAPAEAAAEPAPAPQAAQPASGAQLVQIGAFDNEAQANTQWSRVSGKFGSLMAGKSPVLQRTKVNGRSFVRLRVAGFGSTDEARRFCSALSAEGTDCILARAK